MRKCLKKVIGSFQNYKGAARDICLKAPISGRVVLRELKSGDVLLIWFHPKELCRQHASRAQVYLVERCALKETCRLKGEQRISMQTMRV